MASAIKKLEPVDICIIGAGAGGGVLAKELAEGGVGVLVLDTGVRPQHENIPTIHSDWELRIRDYLPINLKRDTVTLAEDSYDFKVNRHKGIGGSTVHYEGFVQRVHPNDLQRFTQYQIAVDWPISYEELVPLYDRVEKILGVSGALDNPFDPRQSEFPNPPLAFSCATDKLRQAAERIGLHPCHATLAILSRSNSSGRNSCNFCGGCWYGCYQRAISTVAETYVPLAEASGARFREACHATRIVSNSEMTQVLGVEYLDADRQLYFQPAKAVAVCGNAIETARILLNSHPQGLANSSGLVGKNFMSHFGLSMSAYFAERVNGFSGPNVNGMIQDFYESDSSRGYLGGYLIALKNDQLGPYSFYKSWAKQKKLFGAELQNYMLNSFGHTASISAFGEMFPDSDNQVTIDTEVKDIFGLPVPKIRIRLSDNCQKMLMHMQQTLTSILEAAGAEQIIQNIKPGFEGNHLLGTCRMGVNSRQAVTNAWGQSHDIENLFIADGSLFPTATPANPSLTIQALATRVAFKVLELFRQGRF